MKRDLRWASVLGGLLLLTACSSPVQLPSTRIAVPNAPPATVLPIPKAPPAGRPAFQTQDRQNYFHLHRAAWVYKDNKWTLYNNPTWWYFVANSIIFTDLGTGKYYWWYLPHPSQYSGYVYYHTNNQWYAVWRGFDGQ